MKWRGSIHCTRLEERMTFHEWVSTTTQGTISFKDVWHAAQEEMRERCAMVAEDHQLHPEELYPQYAIAASIRALEVM